MRLHCPYCGERGLQEFLYHGDATMRRPRDGGAAPSQEWTDYVYIRDNPDGVHQELWHHGAGCHAWLVVARDLKSHEILGVQAARDAARVARQGSLR